MPFRLLSTTGSQSFELAEGAPLVVGRARACDLPIIHPAVSRRHAELWCEGDAVRVRDLGSSNGTLVNGLRVDEARLTSGDVVTFGSVPFRLVAVEGDDVAHAPGREGVVATPSPPSAILRQQAIDRPAGALSTIVRAANLGEPVSAAPIAEVHARTERKLALLLEVSRGLSRATDLQSMLETMAGMVFQILDVDRVAIDLLDERGGRIPRISRDRSGARIERAVPRSIASKVVDDRVAILSGNAPEDSRFGGTSILAQRVRSAMCAPLIGSADRVEGILYVDNLTTPHRFDDDDLDFLVAFSSIAAVAVENSRFAERIQREALVRSNFERFFTPALAARIAASPGAVQLGGEKRPIAVLFSDIRGFTAIAEGMRPDAVAELLSEYFTTMVGVVFQHGGTLDKFIGDAMLAQWGAPISAPDDPDRAMRAALDMARELDVLNARWVAEGRPRIEIGIGLNYGESFAGYIGSEHRLEYTVIGDAVNTASRLCSAAEGGEILLTEEMRAALAAAPELRERGTMALRGKRQPVPVYSVVR
jgi:adenylate cyclase